MRLCPSHLLPQRGFLKPLDLGKVSVYRLSRRSRDDPEKQGSPGLQNQACHPGLELARASGNSLLKHPFSFPKVLLYPCPPFLLVLLLIFIYLFLTWGPDYGQVNAFLKRSFACAAALPQRRREDQ